MTSQTASASLGSLVLMVVLVMNVLVVTTVREGMQHFHVHWEQILLQAPMTNQTAFAIQGSMV